MRLVVCLMLVWEVWGFPWRSTIPGGSDLPFQTSQNLHVHHVCNFYNLELTLGFCLSLGLANILLLASVLSLHQNRLLLVSFDCSWAYFIELSLLHGSGLMTNKRRRSTIYESMILFTGYRPPLPPTSPALDDRILKRVAGGIVVHERRDFYDFHGFEELRAFS